MAALDDAITKLQGDVTALTAAVANAVAQIASLKAGGVTQAQLDALNGVSTGVENETAALTAAAQP